jgi:sugar phosphate isomerase/epimerase
MIPCPIGIRLNPAAPLREQIREAATLGAKGVVVDAVGDIAPARLSETGRREFRHLLRSVELSFVALSLPTRRAFDTTDQLDERLRRADAAFAMAFELGTTLVLARVGGVPPEDNPEARGIFVNAVRELGRRADHRGVRLALETGPDAGSVVRALLDGLASPGLAASIDPAALTQSGNDLGDTIQALGPWVAHAYAPDGANASRSTVLSRRSGYPSGGIDLEAYCGALEEVNYRGFITIWPEPEQPTGPQFKTMLDRLKRL